MRYWADLQSVHGFRCYDNIVPNVKCQRVLVLALCLVVIITDVSIVQDEQRAINAICLLHSFIDVAKVYVVHGKLLVKRRWKVDKTVQYSDSSDVSAQHCV